MKKQCDVAAWTDPFSKLQMPMNFALAGGPREVPETAKATAEGKAREAREQRRLAQKADAEKQISELQKKVSRFDADIEKLEAKIDARPAGVSPVERSIDWQKHQVRKSEREQARSWNSNANRSGVGRCPCLSMRG